MSKFEFMTKKEAAEYMGVTVRAMERARLSGKQRAAYYRFSQRDKVRYRNQDLDAAIALARTEVAA